MKYIVGNDAIVVASCKYCNALLPQDLITLFCPECGVTIINLEQKMARKRNKNISRVSMRWQVFFAIMPFITFLAAYRIRRLKNSVIIYSIAAFAGFFILFISIAFLPYIVSFQYEEMFLPLVIFLFPHLTLPYFIIKWSRQWNKEISFLEVIDKEL